MTATPEAMDAIVGHSRAKSLFRTALDSARLAHAYLLEGPPGIGKEALSFAVATALLCTRSPGRGCTTCSACRRVKELIHPDLWYYFPHPSTLGETRVAELARDKVAGRQVSFSFPTAAAIPLSDVRLLQKDAAMRPLEGAWKVFIIREAEHLTAEASNALLKILEEPPQHTVIFLTSPASHALMPTVLSRCQRVPMARLSVAEVGTVISERFGIVDDTELWARLSGGSPGRAWELARDDRTQASRGFAAELLERCLSGNRRECLGLADRIASSRDRGLVEAIAEAILGFCRDAIAHQAGDPASVQNIDRRELIGRLGAGRTFAELAEIAGFFSEIGAAVRGNVNLRLAVLAMVPVLRSEQRWRNS